MMERDHAVLAAVSQRRSDRRTLTFIGRRFGKLRLYYRRFPRRVRQEYLSPLQKGELIFTPPGDSAPGRLVSFFCERDWTSLRGDFDSLVCGLHIADLCAHVAGEGEPAPEGYELLVSFLQLLEEGAAPADLRIVGDLKILQAAGLALHLDRCATCRREVGRRGVAFSSRQGGVLCEECRPRTAGVIRRLSGGALSFLRRVQSIPVPNAARLRIGAEMRREVLPLLEEFTEFHLEGQIPSAIFLQALRKSRSF